MRNLTTTIAVALFTVLFSATGQLPAVADSTAESLLQNRAAPSDDRVIRSLASLGSVRFQQKRYQEAEALFKEALELSNKPDRPLDQDRHLADDKNSWMLALAVICLKTDRKNETKTWLSKSKAALHYPAIESSYNLAVDYALIEIAAGLTADAAADIEVAESEAGKRPTSAIRNYEVIAELWNRAGREDKSLAVLKKAKDAKEEKSPSSSGRVTVMNSRNRMPPISVPDIQLQSYLSDIEHSTRRAWSPPKGLTGKRAEVSFKVSPKTGNISDLKLEVSSGVSALDDSAMDAVRRSAPFRQLSDTNRDNVEVRLGFDLNQR